MKAAFIAPCLMAAALWSSAPSQASDPKPVPTYSPARSHQNSKLPPLPAPSQPSSHCGGQCNGQSQYDRPVHPNTYPGLPPRQPIPLPIRSNRGAEGPDLTNIQEGDEDLLPSQARRSEASGRLVRGGESTPEADWDLPNDPASRPKAPPSRNRQGAGRPAANPPPADTTADVEDVQSQPAQANAPTRPAPTLPSVRPAQSSAPARPAQSNAVQQAQATVRREAIPSLPPGLSEKLLQAAAARQTAIEAIKRLTVKREELVRWDAAAKATFQRVFGTTDESLRQHILERIEVEIANKQKVVAQITDAMALELYVMSKEK